MRLLLALLTRLVLVLLSALPRILGLLAGGLVATPTLLLLPILLLIALALLIVLIGHLKCPLLRCLLVTFWMWGSEERRANSYSPGPP